MLLFHRTVTFSQGVYRYQQALLCSRGLKTTLLLFLFLLGFDIFPKMTTFDELLHNDKFLGREQLFECYYRHIVGTLLTIMTYSKTFFQRLSGRVNDKRMFRLV